MEIRHCPSQQQELAEQRTTTLSINNKTNTRAVSSSSYSLFEHGYTVYPQYWDLVLKYYGEAKFDNASYFAVIFYPCLIIICGIKKWFVFGVMPISPWNMFSYSILQRNHWRNACNIRDRIDNKLHKNLFSWVQLLTFKSAMLFINACSDQCYKF
jgi:hypothetical protein